MDDATLTAREMTGAAGGGGYSETAGEGFGEVGPDPAEGVWRQESPTSGPGGGGRAEEDAAEAGGEGMPSWASVRKARAAWWARHVEGRRASGEGRTAYCRRHGLNPAGLYHWERKLGLSAGSGRRLIRPPGCGQGSGPRAGCFPDGRGRRRTRGFPGGGDGSSVRGCPDGADGRGQGGGSGVPGGIVGEAGAEWPFPWPAGAGPASGEGVRFLPLGLLPAPSCGTGLTLWVGPVRVEVTAGFDEELLRRVVRALGVV